MHKLWLIFIFCSLGLWSGALYAQPPQARVLIDEEAKSQDLVGEIYIECLGPTRHRCRQKSYFLKAGTWRVTDQKNKIRIRNVKNKTLYELPGYHFRFKGQFKFQGQAIRQLDLHIDLKKPQWVLHLPLDRYLQGVLASEVPASWPAEALKAQAIASRTYFLFKKEEREKERFDVHASVMDQVFALDSEKHQSLIEAVNQTAGLVLHEKGSQKIFPAYFHSDCGGHTSSEGNVWRKPASVNHSVKDPVCAEAKRNNWKFYINKDKLLALLHKAFLIPHGVILESVLPRIQDEGRAHFVDFMFSGNILKRMSANDFRKLIGFGKLKSTQFHVSQKWDEVVFAGRGFGHGVGMCQWGAQRWARRGKDFRSILRHYYPGAVIGQTQTQSSEQQQAQLTF